MRQLLLPLTIILVSTAILTATDWWEKKPFMEWSAGEVDQLLNDSPWSGVTPFSARIRTPISSYPISWRILLLSAKPVREAYLRRRPIPWTYKKGPISKRPCRWAEPKRKTDRCGGLVLLPGRHHEWT